MKNKRNKNLKEGHISSLTTHNSGITLIALVVTIVVLIILSGITISMIFSDNGVFKTVGDAANQLNEILETTLGELEQIEDEMTEDDWWRTNYTVANEKTAQIELYSIYYSEYSEEDAETEIPEIIQKKTYTITYPDGETTTVLGKKLGTFKYTYQVEENGPVTIKIVSTKETTLTVAVEGIVRDVVTDPYYTYTLTSYTDAEGETVRGYSVKVINKQLESYGKIQNEIDGLHIISLEQTFMSCGNMTSVDLEGLKTDYVTSMKQMFYGCNNLAELKFSDKFNTSNVTSMYGMFGDCKKLEQLDVSNFDTSKVTNMMLMFYECNNVTQLDVSKFDTSNVTDMTSMFFGCSNVTQLDVSKFDTSNVTSMSGMFSYCSKLEKLDLSGFNTSEVKSMESMFFCCNSLTELKFSDKFNTSNVNSMANMFYGCESLTELKFSDKFNTSKVNNMSNMFYGCESLTELDLSSFDTGNVTTMENMFYNCTELETIHIGNKWVTAAIADGMFANCGIHSESELTLKIEE